MKFAMIALSAAVLGGSGYAIWQFKAAADFERGRQQFLADTTDLVPAKPQEPERYLFIDKAIASGVKN